MSCIVKNIVFFCTTCLQRLPYALQSCDHQVHVNSKLESMESQLSEVQSTGHKLSEAVKKVESQLCDYRKSLESMLNDQSPVNAEPLARSARPISEDSIAQITFSLVAEQKEKEKHQLNIIMHNLEESSAPDGFTRKQDDIKKCISVFETYLDTSPMLSAWARNLLNLNYLRSL